MVFWNLKLAVGVAVILWSPCLLKKGSFYIIGKQTSGLLCSQLYITLLSLRVLKSYQTLKFEFLHFLSKTHFTFLLWLITFEPLEQNQSYIPLLKVLICGMNARGVQRLDGIFILRYTSLKMAVLLHKSVLVNFPIATSAL